MTRLAPASPRGLPDADPRETWIRSARLAVPGGPVDGALRIVGDRIAEIRLEADAPPSPPGAARRADLDWGGDVLLPGIVDIHTDHVEKHVFPRTHVRWDYAAAILAHDAQMIGAGVTTVFDSLSVGVSEKRPERREILGPTLDAIEALQEAGALKAEHFLHLRCEVSDPQTPQLARDNVARAAVRVASVMNHAPGDRQSKDVERYIGRMAEDIGISVEEMRARAEELIARAAEVAERVRAETVALIAARGLPLMSHDDASVAHVAQAVAEGAGICEFPTTLEAAREARRQGMSVVAGAPNFLRGGSQSGNVAVKDLLAEGLVDMLASDYVPRSLVDAVFAIAEDPALETTLDQAAAMASRAPAEAAGLTDRGALSVGLRADLIRVRPQAGAAVVAEAWVAGRRVA